MIGVKTSSSLIVFLILSFFMIPLQAQNLRSFTNVDWQMLPPYCQVKLANKVGKEVDHNANKLWAQRLGESWKNLHHYCMGLIFMNRARYTIDKKKRRILLNMASTELNIINKWPPNAPLLMMGRMHLKQVELMKKQR